MLPILLFAAALSRTAVAPSVPMPSQRYTSACFALSPGDIEFALGRAVGLTSREQQAAASTCDYAGGRGQVSVTIQHLDREIVLADELAALRHEIEGAQVRPAQAFGDGAFFLEIAGAGAQLHVIRGREYLMISALGFGEGLRLTAALEKMARIALERVR